MAPSPLGDPCITPSPLRGKAGMGVKRLDGKQSKRVKAPLDSGFHRNDGAMYRSPGEREPEKTPSAAAVPEERLHGSLSPG